MNFLFINLVPIPIGIQAGRISELVPIFRDTSSLPSPDVSNSELNLNKSHEHPK
jgi:hypothetical protein